MRRRKFKRAPVAPLLFGGGQERGSRPGTLPVPLVAGLGVAAALCSKHVVERSNLNRVFREKLFKALDGLHYQVNGDVTRSVPNAANISFSGLNSEAIMLALKNVVAISNGSACTSQSYEPSHVLRAMGLPDSRINSAVRFSWCHLTAEPDWAAFLAAIKTLL